MKKYQDIETFTNNIDEAFAAAESGEVVEIWENGDYFVLEYRSLKADS
jgi:hypothetical protein